MKRALVTIAIVVGGCAREPAALDGLACPCVEAFACCPATDTCMPEGLADCPFTLHSIDPAEGSVAGGAVVTLIADDMPVDVEIFLGELPCPVRAIDATTVTCVAPPSPMSGPVDVIASTRRGRRAVLGDGFTYTPAPVDPTAPCDTPTCPIVIDSVTPTAGPTTGGTLLTIRGRDLPAAPRFHLGDVPCADVLILDSTHAQCRTGAAPTRGLVPLHATDAAESRVGALADAFRYLSPDFTDVTHRLGAGRVLWDDGMGVNLADFDADGTPDVLFSHTTTRNPGVFRGGAALTLDAIGEGLGVSGLPFHESLALARIDGDARPDGLLSVRFRDAGAFGSNLGFMRGIAGGFEAPAPIPLLEHDTQAGQQLDVRPIDLDGDGDLDLLGCWRVPWIGDGARLLAQVDNVAGALVEQVPAIIADPAAAPTGCHALAMADFDRDGDVDVALCDASLRVYRNDDDGWRDATAALGLRAWFDDAGLLLRSCHALSWVDVDADGRLDLAWSSRDAAGRPELGAGVNIARNTGDRFVPLRLDHAVPSGDTECPGPASTVALRVGEQAIAWLDADHDGDLDLLAPVPYPTRRCVQTPYLLRNQFAQGEAAFTVEPIALDPVSGVVHLRGVTGSMTGDLDGDGDLDLAVATWGGGRRIILRNNVVENGVGAFLVVAPTTDPDGDATDADQSDDFVAPHVPVLIDLDGPADAPDFAPGPGALAASGDARGFASSGPAEQHFGLGAIAPPVWIRVRFADGSVAEQRVDTFDTRVIIRDCAASRCPP